MEVDEVRKGFNNLQDNKKDLLLYHEAKTRKIIDRIVGMNGSRLYTFLLQQKGFGESLSIGRVQLYPIFLGVIINALIYMSCTNSTRFFSGGTNSNSKILRILQKKK